jgi:hypothetical protein
VNGSVTKAHVYPINGEVVITFAVPVSYLNLSPNTVDQFVKLLTDCAQSIRNAKSNHDEPRER